MESMSKKVLIVAYQFPPMGGSGVQRSTKFAKYLTQLGYEVTVFTIDFSSGVMDASLNEELDGVKVVRTKPYDFSNWKGPFKLLGKVLKRKVLIPDGEYYWYMKVRKQALSLVDEIKPDILYTTSYPYSDHLIGRYIKMNRPTLKWVVDFRDEWTKNPYIIDMNYSKLRKRIEQKMEKSVIENCDHLITNSPQMLEGFLTDYGIRQKSSVIPNGYDPYDFEGIQAQRESNDKFVITYTGSMYGRRKPEFFLRGLRVLIDDGLIDVGSVEVKLVGHFNEASKKLAYDLIGYRSILSFYDYAPHKESIQFLMASDLLLLIVGPGIGSKNFYTGKIFEYLYTGKPIFAMVPKDGAAASVVIETKTGFVADSDDFDEIKNTLLTIYTKWSKGNLELEPNHDKIAQYNRRRQTEDLSKVFVKLLDR